MFDQLTNERARISSNNTGQHHLRLQMRTALDDRMQLQLRVPFARPVRAVLGMLTGPWSISRTGLLAVHNTSPASVSAAPKMQREAVRVNQAQQQ
jgi:hypothetical protein